MENFSQSFSKESYGGSNGLSATSTMYDDVFGAPPKLGVPTLSPRVEDYGEIFGGFHSSGGSSSSIPVLDLSMVHDSALSFDVWNSNFEYSEVFGSLDFAVCYEELFNKSDVGDDSSEEAWTPAHSETLSDGSDPSACSEKSQVLFNADSSHSFDYIKQFNVSYLMPNLRSNGDMSKGMMLVTQLHTLPGYSFMNNETPDSRKLEDKNPSIQVNNDTEASMEFFGRHTDEKHFGKSMSHPENNSFGVIGHNGDPLEDFSTSDYTTNETFVGVTDICLTTWPSRLPPPSRPPPVFARQRKGCPDIPISKLRASKSCSFERNVGESAPTFLDVEVDASSSAEVSSAAMKRTLEKAQAKLGRAKELMERTECNTKNIIENDISKCANEKISSAFNEYTSIEDGSMGRACGKEVNLIKSYSGKERKYGSRTPKVGSDSVQYFAERNQVKDHGSYQASANTEGTFAWKEAAQFYQVVETENCRKALERIRDENVWVRDMKSNGKERERVKEAAKLQEDVRTMKASEQGHKLDENDNHLKVSINQTACQEKTKVDRRDLQLEEREGVRLQEQYGECEKMSGKTYKCYEGENMKEIQTKKNKMETSQQVNEGYQRIRNWEKKVDSSDKQVEEILNQTCRSGNYELRFKQAVERSENEKKLSEGLELEEKHKQTYVRKDNERTYERTENENILEDAKEQAEIEKRLKEPVDHEQKVKGLIILEQEMDKNEKVQNLAKGKEGNKRWLDENEKQLKEALLCGKDEMKLKEADEREENENIISYDCEREENGSRLKKDWNQEEHKIGLHQASARENSEKTSETAVEEEIVRRSNRATERGPIETKDDVKFEIFSIQSKENRKIETGDNKMKVNSGHNISKHMEVKYFKASDSVAGLDNGETIHATIMAEKQNKNKGTLEAMCETFSSEENIQLNTELEDSEEQLETVEEENVLSEERLNSSDLEQDVLQQNNQISNEDVKELHSHCDNQTTSNEILNRKINILRNKPADLSELENMNVLTQVQEERIKNVREVQFNHDQGTRTDEFRTHQLITELAGNKWNSGHAMRYGFENKQKVYNAAEKVRSQVAERKENFFTENVSPKDREEVLERENDLLRKIEEEREREREREKDRMVVDRVTLEASKRAFSDARERAERAAGERAAAEARQRAMSEARERLEKASMEARLRVERAAVERATTEARERAFQKAMAERVGFEAQERVEKPVAKFSASLRSGELRQSFSFSDIQFQRMGTSSSLKYSYSSIYDGVEGESPQRCKARLERHQRMAERAAKALAEKNMRDLLAQREQAERNRLAETLDAEVKRWSSGKEGNLRALLSTLQYILGPDSGWQSIPLTEVITSAAVKKAYRKATLSVHPDKLQQRRASIQHKYICEKVFDLLKEAWNKFNSEER